MIKLTYDFSDLKKVKRSLINTAMRRALYTVGEHWHKKYLPMHFGDGASARYKYEGRKVGYLRRKKQKQKGRREWTRRDLKPLEFTGDAKREALNTKRIKSAFRGGEGYVRISLPAKFNWKHPNSAVRMNEEIRTVREDELQALAAILASEFDRQIVKSSGGAFQRKAGFTLRGG